MRKGILLVLLLCLTACGGSGSKTSTNQQEIDDRADLQSTYQPIVGTYKGTVKTAIRGTDDYPIQIDLFIVDEPNGVNDKGELKMRPALHANYTRLDLSVPELTQRPLVVRYYQNSSVNNITMSTQTALSPNNGSTPSLPNSNYLSIQGTISDGHITGQIFDWRGLQGTFDISKQ